MLITRDDIQRIGDEDTLMHFLEEKLNLPIPEETTLARNRAPLATPFPWTRRFDHRTNRRLSGF